MSFYECYSDKCALISKNHSIISLYKIESFPKVAERNSERFCETQNKYKMLTKSKQTR